MPANERNTVFDDGLNTAGQLNQAYNTGKDVQQAAKGLKEVAEAHKAANAAKTAATAAEAGKAAATAAKVATEAATGNVAGAAVTAVKESKTGKRLAVGLVIIFITIPLVLALIINTTFATLNGMWTTAREEAAAETISDAGMTAASITNFVEILWDKITGVITNDDSGDDAASRSMDQDDTNAIGDEASAQKSTRLKIQGTQLRVNRRVEYLEEYIYDSSDDEAKGFCMDQSPDMTWDFSPGLSTVTVTVNVPGSFSETDALRVLAAHSTQTATESNSVTVQQFLNWVGKKDSFFDTYEPWTGTYVSQPVYEERLQRINVVKADTSLTEDEKEDKIEEIQEEYKQYETALVNYLVLVEDPKITTWTETRDVVETYIGYVEEPIYEGGHITGTHMVPKTLERTVQRQYGCGSVVYPIRYLSTDELASLEGLWTLGVGMQAGQSNGNRRQSTTLGSTFTGYSSLQGSDLVGLSHQEYIELLGPVFTQNYQQTGLLASVGLAQLILECGWNPSTLATEANNMFGIKAGTVYDSNAWDGTQTYVKETREYVDGHYVTDTASFRKYDSIGACVADRSALLLSNSRYAGLSTTTDYRAACQLLQDAGYATDPAYASKLISIIETNDLTRFDDLTATVDTLGGQGNGNTQYYLYNEPSQTYQILLGTDPTYSGSAMELTPMEEQAVKNAMWGESRECIGGAIMVGQVIHDMFLYLGAVDSHYDTIQKIINNAFTSMYWNSSPLYAGNAAYTNVVETAYDWVFNQGNAYYQRKLVGEMSTALTPYSGWDFVVRVHSHSDIYGSIIYITDPLYAYHGPLTMHVLDPGGSYGDAVNPKAVERLKASTGTTSTTVNTINLSTELPEKAGELDGTWSVFYKNLDTDEIISSGGDTTVKAGRLIDLYIAGAYLNAVENAGWEDLYRTELQKMLQNSDDNATNTIIDYLGITSINEFIASYGFTSTQLNKKMLEDGTDNTTSASDCALLLELLNEKTFVSTTASETILEYGFNDPDGNKIKSGLIGGETLKGISGSEEGIESDIAIVQGTDGTYLLCIIENDAAVPEDAVKGFQTLSQLVSSARNPDIARSSGEISDSTNVQFSKTFFEDHKFFYSDRFGFDESDPDNALYKLKKNLELGRDDNYKLLYTWKYGEEKMVRLTSYQDDYYYDQMENTAEYIGLVLGGSSLSGGSGSGGKSLAAIAEQEYQKYGGQRGVGANYWPGGAQDWCCDFVYWCADQLGFVGSGQLFGPKTSYCPTAVTQLYDAGAMIYYPGDGTVPQAGDIIFFNTHYGRPGNASDGVSDWACHIGIVVGGTSTTVTVIEGNTAGNGTGPSGTTISKNTYNLTGECWSGAYILEFFRPNYPSTASLDPSDHAGIQKVMLQFLYNGATGGSVTCDFDGYVSTSGRHEGIDFAKGTGSRVYSLINGEIVAVVEGSSSSVSLVSIYDSSNNKSVVYLHLDPSNSLRVGQYVQRGDLLGTEASRGASGAHTHIEVVNGRSTYAMKSVDDYTLDNENPYPYWALALSGSGDAVISTDHPDSAYQGHAVALTDSQRLLVARALGGESTDGTYETWCALCQYIRDYIDFGAINRTYDNIGSFWLKSASRGNCSTWSLSDFQTKKPDVLRAIEFMFDNGGCAFQGRCGGYYDKYDGPNGRETLLRVSGHTGHDHDFVPIKNQYGEYMTFYVCYPGTYWEG